MQSQTWGQILGVWHGLHVVTQHVVLLVRDRHHTHGHTVVEDSSVGLVKVQPLGDEGAIIMQS
jgi:hypothetical protein